MYCLQKLNLKLHCQQREIWPRFVERMEESEHSLSIAKNCLIEIFISIYNCSTSDLESSECKREPLGLDSDVDGMIDQRKKKKRKHKHHKHKKEKLIERDDERLDKQER